MTKRLIAVFMLLLVVCSLGLAGCHEQAAGSSQKIPRPTAKVLENFDPVLAESANELGMKLLKKLYVDGENVFFSPLSVSTALAMTYNGARGETKEKMAAVLEVEEVELERLNENNLALLYLLQEADPSVKLQIANSLWGRDGIEFDKDFVARNEKYYNALLRELDFNSPAAAETINRWVKDRTDGLIEGIVEPPIDPLTILFLINAIYFQGDWSQPFDPENTQEDTFYLPKGETENIALMHRSGKFDYYEDNNLQAVRLPYGKEKRLAMSVFLPAQGSCLQEFTEQLTAGKWNELRGQFTEAEGSLFLPRFSLEYEKNLNNTLKALGMEIAFDSEKADFMEMVTWEGEPRLYISEVKHKAFVEVHEKGTEAAGATSVEMKLECAPLFSFTMKVNRPFFFLIEDEETGTILFMGALSFPESP
jgi:serine protease inhibitor